MAGDETPIEEKVVTPPQTIIIQQKGAGVTGILSIITGGISVFFLAMLFAPLGFLTGGIGLFSKGTNRVLSIVGIILSILGVVTSPMIMLMLGLSAASIHSSKTATSPAPAPVIAQAPPLPSPALPSPPPAASPPPPVVATPTVPSIAPPVPSGDAGFGTIKSGQGSQPADNATPTIRPRASSTGTDPGDFGSVSAPPKQGTEDNGAAAIHHNSSDDSSDFGTATQPTAKVPAPPPQAPEAPKPRAVVQPSLPASLSGNPTIVEDTSHLIVGGKKITLLGVSGLSGKSAIQLKDFLASQGGTVNCSLSGSKYYCKTATGVDVAEAAVVNGAAKVSSDGSSKLLSLQKEAQTAHRGIWE
jgi:hypothetical protein